MDDFTYSVVRSFNQYVNTNFSCGTDEQLLLDESPPYTDLDKDTVACHFYDENIKEVGLGRQTDGTRKGRFGEFWLQADVMSPPDEDGFVRDGANRKLKDKFEDVLKSSVRINLLEWDGTGGSTIAGGMFVRQEGATWVETEMEGWSRWRLGFYMRAVDHE